MDISNLGSDCYRHFERRKVLRALADVEALSVLRQSQLSEDQASAASERGCRRLALYYSHLRLLLQHFPEGVVKDAVRNLDRIEAQDKKKLAGIYRRLSKKTNSPGNRADDADPGMALFLQVDDRSVALIPDFAPSSQENHGEPVYMASAWKRAILSEQPTDFATRILRSNRLWQRERWWVEPVSDAPPDTAELFVNVEGRDSFSLNTYFNDISRHFKAIDGWVDAFWGVQSGIRLVIPVEDLPNTRLVILLTTFLPDAFKAWNHTDQYVKEVPHEVAQRATDRLLETFKAEIRGLTFAASALKDVTASETSLMSAAMRMLAHYTSNQVKEKQVEPWEVKVFHLVDKLALVSPALCLEANELESPKDYVLSRLEQLALRLPPTELSESWKRELRSIRDPGENRRFSFLPRECTVRDLCSALKSLERDMESTVDVKADNLLLSAQLEGVDSYLLTAIAENLLSRHNAHLQIFVTKERDFGRSYLNIAALYPKWRITPEDEVEFLLKPLKPLNGRAARRVLSNGTGPMEM